MPPSPASTPTSAVPRSAEHRAVVDVLGASVLFATCNVAWRYGDGSTVVMVFIRAALGAAFAMVLVRRRPGLGWRRAVRSRPGVAAMVAGGASLVAAGTLFRTLDGPVAALALACTPAVATLLRDKVGPLAVAAAVGSSAAAAVGILGAALRSGDGPDVGWVGVAVAVAFVAVDVIALRAAQLAVQDGVAATNVVAGSMVVATVALAPVAGVVAVADGVEGLGSTAIAALVVATLGTLGRVLRTAALPAAGIAAAAASVQVTALGVAVGGVLLFDDALDAFGVVCAVLAAGLGATAVVAGARWRTGRARDERAGALEPVDPAAG